MDTERTVTRCKKATPASWSRRVRLAHTTQKIKFVPYSRETNYSVAPAVHKGQRKVRAQQGNTNTTNTSGVKSKWTVQPMQTMYDYYDVERNVEDMGHHATVHCPKCDFKHGRPDGDPSAVTVIKGPDVGWFCWGCAWPKKHEGVMHWMKGSLERRLPGDNIRSLVNRTLDPDGVDPAVPPLRLGDVVRVDEISRAKFTAIDAPTGAGECRLSCGL